MFALPFFFWVNAFVSWLGCKSHNKRGTNYLTDSCHISKEIYIAKLQKNILGKMKLVYNYIKENESRTNLVQKWNLPWWKQ